MMLIMRETEQNTGPSSIDIEREGIAYLLILIMINVICFSDLLRDSYG